MPWLIGLNVLLYIGAGVLYFTGFGILALICLILAVLLSLILLSATGSDGATIWLDDIYFD